MRRVFVLVFVVISSLLVACGDEDEPKSPSTSSPGTGESTSNEEGTPEENGTPTTPGDKPKPSKPPEQCKKAEQGCTVDMECCSGSCSSERETCN